MSKMHIADIGTHSTHLAHAWQLGTADKVLFSCVGGQVICIATAVYDHADRGNLVVVPPLSVWKRDCSRSSDLALWSLPAAAGQARMDELPQPADACLNSWEAANGVLNSNAEPEGSKDVQAMRWVHLHMFGRSRDAKPPDWKWGESARLPAYSEHLAWTSAQHPLNEAECDALALQYSKLFENYTADIGGRQ